VRGDRGETETERVGDTDKKTMRQKKKVRQREEREQ